MRRALTSRNHQPGCFFTDGYKDVLESLWTLEMDLEPFNSHFPIMTRPSSIGDGVRFLNRCALLHAPGSLASSILPCSACALSMLQRKAYWHGGASMLGADITGIVCGEPGSA